MGYRKNISGVTLRCDFLPDMFAEPGEVVEVPETQPDGSELIWHTDFWQPVTKDGKPVKAEKDA